jgi:hypothetical protein
MTLRMRHPDVCIATRDPEETYTAGVLLRGRDRSFRERPARRCRRHTQLVRRQSLVGMYGQLRTPNHEERNPVSIERFASRIACPTVRMLWIAVYRPIWRDGVFVTLQIRDGRVPREILIAIPFTGAKSCNG